MNDQTLLCLAGGGLLIWWIASGSGAASRVESRLDIMEQIDTEIAAADVNKDSRIAYYMNAVLKNTDEFRNMTGQEFTKLTKQKLVDFVNVALCGKDRTLDNLKRLSDILLRVHQEEGQGRDNSLLITQHLYKISLTFLKAAIEAVERTIKIVSEIHQQLPDESKDSSERLLYDARKRVQSINEL